MKSGDSISKLVISKGYMEFSHSKVRFQPANLEKNSRQAHLPPVIDIPAYYTDTRLCPVYYLRAYLKRTKDLRTSDSLFITVSRPHSAAAVSTLRTYLVEALNECGAFGSAGSTRSASSSKARAQGAHISTILEAGDWASSRTFKKFYYKAVPLEYLSFVLPKD